MDEVIRQISIATRNDASKSSAGSDHGHTLPSLSPASCDVKTEAASPPSLPAQDAPSPSQGPGGFRRSRRATRRVTYYSGESDSSTGIDCARSQDIDEYSLAASAEGVEVEVEDEDEDERPLRKRRKLSMPSTRETGSGAARVERSYRAGTPSRYPRRPVKGRRRVQATCIASPTSSDAPITDSDLGAMLTRHGGWSLENASLRCMAENGKPVFQLQFNLSPGLLHDRASIASGRPKSSSVRAMGKAHQSTSTRLRYTRSEDDLLLKLKAEEKLPWSEIRQRFCEVFPSRPMESLQVHYSTKVKHRERY